MTAKTARIDLPHHVLPPEYLHMLSKAGMERVMGVEFPEWEVDKSLLFMKNMNIAAAVVSISSPGL